MTERPCFICSSLYRCRHREKELLDDVPEQPTPARPPRLAARSKRDEHGVPVRLHWATILIEHVERVEAQESARRSA